MEIEFELDNVSPAMIDLLRGGPAGPPRVDAAATMTVPGPAGLTRTQKMLLRNRPLPVWRWSLVARRRCRAKALERQVRFYNASMTTDGLGSIKLAADSRRPEEER